MRCYLAKVLVKKKVYKVLCNPFRSNVSLAVFSRSRSNFVLKAYEASYYTSMTA